MIYPVYLYKCSKMYCFLTGNLYRFGLVSLALLTLVSCGGIEDVSINEAPTVSNVIILDDDGGKIEPGDTLVGSYDYSDLENDLEGASRFRWLRDGDAIVGASKKRYTLVADDNDSVISFEVTPVAATGTDTGIPVISPGVTVANEAPVARTVRITDINDGDTVVGDTLVASYVYSDADGDPEGGSLYRWLRNGVAISGANASSYTLVAADSGKSISFEVTPLALTGVDRGKPAVSNSIFVVNSAPVITAVSIIDNNGGPPLVGDVLSGSNYSYLAITVILISMAIPKVIACTAGCVLAQPLAARPAPVIRWLLLTAVRRLPLKSRRWRPLARPSARRLFPVRCLSAIPHQPPPM